MGEIASRHAAGGALDAIHPPAWRRPCVAFASEFAAGDPEYHRHGRLRSGSKQRGTTLAAALVIMAATTLLATAALRAARSAAHVAGAVVAEHDAFRLAELGVAAGMRVARNRPELLPAAGQMSVSPVTAAGAGQASTRIVALGSDADCPALAPLPAIRRHYEIHATGYADRGAVATHVQGFYICAEVCDTAYCEAAEQRPVATYWRSLMGYVTAAIEGAE